jgi:RNA polymerase sigma factor (sigma-70 family)
VSHDGIDRTDEQLMIRLANGDGSALRPLVDRYQTQLYLYLYRTLNGNFAAAQDAVQETFLRLINQRSYQPSRPFRPWLYRVATNVATDYLRRSQPVPLNASFVIADTGPGPETTAELSERAEVVRAALHTLPYELRTVLLLRFYQDLSLQEIADALDIPMGTVKSRLFNAVRRLREGMAAEVAL